MTTFFLVVYKKISRYPFYFSFSSTKNTDDFFLVISSISSYVSALPNAAGTTAQPTFCIIHSQNFTLLTILFYAFSTVAVQNLQLQLHNSHFTTANYILQLHKLSSVAR